MPSVSEVSARSDPQKYQTVSGAVCSDKLESEESRPTTDTGRIVGGYIAVRNWLCQTRVIAKMNERCSWMPCKEFTDRCQDVAAGMVSSPVSRAITPPRSPRRSRSPSVLYRPGCSGGMSHGKRESMSEKTKIGQRVNPGAHSQSPNALLKSEDTRATQRNGY